MFTCSRSYELLDAQAGVQHLDGERAAALVPEHDEPTEADTVYGQELRPPAPQERTVAVLTHLDWPHRAERADHDGRWLWRPFAFASVEAPGELVGDALWSQSVGFVSTYMKRSRRLRSTGGGGRLCLPACGKN